MRLIVVGAGMAGLTVADAARCDGAEVVVLEARDRIGGRTWTVELGSGLVDLGAAWVHGPIGNPLAEALEAARIGTRNDGSYCSRMAVWAGGGWVDAPDATALTAAFEADWDPAQAASVLAGGDRFSDGIEWYIENRGLDGRAAELVRFALGWMAGALVIGADPDRISLAGAAAYVEGGGGNLVPSGGYRSLVERLAAGLDVRLGEAVTAVEHGGSAVRAHTDAGSYEADRVVVTAPLGVLRAGAIRFDPPLPTGHAGSLSRLAMGTAEKLVLRFPRRFWPDSVRHLTHVADDRAFQFWDDVSAHVGSPTLVAFHNPATTPSLAGLSDEQRLGRALAALRRMFGRVPEPEEALATDWANDPHSLGCYSYVPVGAEVEDMRRLAEPPSERLSLAGEVTVPACYGTVHAAFLSGLRAARWALGRPPERLSLGAVPRRWLAAA